MVQYFGDKKGLRNQDFGQSGVALPVFPRAPFDSDSGDEENRENEEDDSGPQAEDEEHKVGEEENEGEYDDDHNSEADSLDESESVHADSVDAEVARHDSMRNKRKLGLPEALVAMGESLATASSLTNDSNDTTTLSHYFVRTKTNRRDSFDNRTISSDTIVAVRFANYKNTFTDTAKEINKSPVWGNFTRGLSDSW
ncbi:hypothetical protein PC111_g13615 [Phytophthora cactorum]|nr:hypothetical protein PC111_g13615 [Phytophthora cactorum]KAG3074141.1 hypothetical protein PC122_g14517 [Phytophthora cactorum]